jgi:hypothetical protein
LADRHKYRGQALWNELNGALSRYRGIACDCLQAYYARLA